MSETMRKPRPDMRGLPRFLAAAVLVALMYVGLQEAWVAIFGAIARHGSTPTWVLTGPVQKEAESISAESASKEASLTPMHRRAAFQLGYNVGYSAGARGSVLMLNDAARAQLGQVLVPQEQAARNLAEFLKVGEVRPLRVGDAAENLRLPEAIEADQNGMAARVEAVTAPRHKQLYLLGVHAGVAVAQVDFSALQGGQVWPVPSLQIARHATLAGVPRSLWSPLIHVPPGADPKRVAEAYRRSVVALDEALGDPRTFGAAATR